LQVHCSNLTKLKKEKKEEDKKNDKIKEGREVGNGVPFYHYH
jgi:hypothetical protein